MLDGLKDNETSEAYGKRRKDYKASIILAKHLQGEKKGQLSGKAFYGLLCAFADNEAAYNVIENKMIDAILSDRAEERRALFEEAAGIGKYKDRRKAAQRRMERAEMDLQRLEDVISEVQTKVRSLARQKGKAERYFALRARRLDVEVAVVKG